MSIAIIIIVVIAICIVIMYNDLVRTRNRVNNAWSQVDVQLQRRFDLIPNLVDSVKGYMNHEESTLSKIAELRTTWANTTSIQEKAKLEGELSTALKSIMAVSENYPELKANQNFLQLQEELKNTESKIAYARQFYNDVVTKFNTKLEVFPTNMIGRLFKFELSELFQVESEEVRNNVKVDFSSKE